MLTVFHSCGTSRRRSSALKWARRASRASSGHSFSISADTPSHPTAFSSGSLRSPSANSSLPISSIIPLTVACSCSTRRQWRSRSSCAASLACSPGPSAHQRSYVLRQPSFTWPPSSTTSTTAADCPLGSFLTKDCTGAFISLDCSKARYRALLRPTSGLSRRLCASRRSAASSFLMPALSLSLTALLTSSPLSLRSRLVSKRLYAVSVTCLTPKAHLADSTTARISSTQPVPPLTTAASSLLCPLSAALYLATLRSMSAHRARASADAPLRVALSSASRTAASRGQRTTCRATVGVPWPSPHPLRSSHTMWWSVICSQWMLSFLYGCPFRMSPLTAPWTKILSSVLSTAGRSDMVLW